MKMKEKKATVKASTREQIMHSALASFRIEGIHISQEQAFATLKKIETNLGR
jgi:hypothetical protein